jgi:hypothetical protein
MAKTITLYKVFVASPSDVKDERNSLDAIINEINRTTANILGVQLELVKWETHTYPDFGEDPQDVINKQIGNDYDIFIGVLWGRFGTPTKRESSGTKEEFLRAYERWKTQKEKQIKIMFYIKEAGIPVNQIDVEQIKAVQEFKSEIASKGGLYWPFKDVEEFQSLVRFQLNSALSDLVNLNKSNTTSPTQIDIQNTPIKIIEDDTVEEIGLLDSIEDANNKLEDASEVLINISRYLNELTEKTNERTKSLNRLSGASESIRIRESKRVIDKSAEDLINFVNRTKVETPIFKDLVESGFSALSNAISIWKTFSHDPEEILKVRDQVSGLKEIISNSIVQITGFRDTIQSLPSMTGSFIKAKRQTTNVIEELIKHLDFTIQLTEEFEKKL